MFPSSLCFLALVARGALSAPANSGEPQISSFGSTQAAAPTSLFSQSTLNNDHSGVPLTTSLSNTSSLQRVESNDQSSTVSVTSLLSSAPLPLSPSSAMATSTSPVLTNFVTEVVTAFETVTVERTAFSPSVTTVAMAATSTVTAVVTTIPSPSWSNRTLWAAPPQMTDLSAFNITYFPSGQRNLHIVDRIPSEALASMAKSLQDPLLSPPDTNTTVPSTFLQLLYPAHSVNPGSRPEGGADFYSTPLNLAGARNVTLAYSVFFPVNFDWVKGGKLPGLFGGHTGCSGGASAQNCFSTRLMWRPHGAGELYLYAPKDKQSKALCADVRSVCDTTYGFSIGRGAFNFTAGNWTRLSQNIVLNTPGQNDGYFTLEVDGRPTIYRTDMFYRNSIAQRVDENQTVAQPAEFLGLFFSTFFGGHGKAYATPKQQSTWFKDFVIARYD